MGYSYDRRVASLFFDNFQALPRRATAGSSLSSIRITVEPFALGYRANFDMTGTLKGDMQSVVDEMRMCMLDIHQIARRFFSRLKLPRSNARVMEQGAEDIIISPDKGVHLHTHMTFSLDDPVPEDIFRAALQQAAMSFGSIVELASVSE